MGLTEWRANEWNYSGSKEREASGTGANWRRQQSAVARNPPHAHSGSGTCLWERNGPAASWSDARAGPQRKPNSSLLFLAMVPIPSIPYPILCHPPPLPYRIRGRRSKKEDISLLVIEWHSLFWEISLFRPFDSSLLTELQNILWNENPRHAPGAFTRGLK